MATSFSLADGRVEPVQPRRVLARADHEKPRERRAQGGDSLHVIEMMMGQQRMGQPPAEAVGFAANSLAVRRVDRRRRAARLVADEQAKIILEANELVDFEPHPASPLANSRGAYASFSPCRSSDPGFGKH